MDGLLLALLAYAAASLFHHVHNAEFLDQYPNMPAWLSPVQVYVAWLGATAIGLIGYWSLRRGYRVAGLALLAGYGCYGLDSLAHYALAPLSAHTLAMNLSIGLEAATAAGLQTVTSFIARTSPRR
jgi:hypothetical protein